MIVVVVAGTCHDHIFVPYARSHDAMSVLFQLQREHTDDA
jgi:hypothetical protein